MATTTAVMTARRACQILDWVIKYLTIALERLCPKEQPPVPAAETASAQIWEADCAPPDDPMAGEAPPWDIDCPPPKKPSNVDLCEALAACIEDLKKLRRSLRRLPPGRRLG
jgi:hypothetical protein